jgi:hypothetical protein
MAEAMSSNYSSQPASSHSAQTTFSNTSTTSLASTLTTTSTFPPPKWNIHKPQYDAKGQKLDAMARKYLVSEEQLSVDDLLSLPPLPRTFRYEVQKDDDQLLRKRKEKIEEEAKRKMREELEAAKKMLRDLALK